jgi:hypothetical protein
MCHMGLWTGNWKYQVNSSQISVRIVGSVFEEYGVSENLPHQGFVLCSIADPETDHGRLDQILTTRGWLLQCATQTIKEVPFEKLGSRRLGTESMIE